MNDFSFRRVRAVFWKEMVELRRNRSVWIGVILLPVLFVGISFVALSQFSRMTARDLRNVRVPPEILARIEHPGEFLALQFSQMFLMVFLLMPAVLPSAVAAYAVVGEKNSRSLEPLLATPLRTSELLLGKLAAAALLGILPSWISYGVFVSMLASMFSPFVWMQAASAPAVLTIFTLGPLLAVLSVSCALLVSSRVNDPQAAQSLSAAIALPVVGIGVAQLAGAMRSTVGIVSIIASLVLLLDAVAFTACVALFERESILTRWK